MVSRATLQIRPLLMFRLLTLSLVALFSSALCHAKNNCPWLNEATASGLLGGDAIGEFTDASTSAPAVCTFTEKDGAASRILRITVEVTPDYVAKLKSAEQSCGADAAAIQAIGNEAISCAADDRKGALGERVVGRVRDQVFTIAITASAKGDLLLTRPILKTKIYTAAEQVAGNLY
jgi:hypothetical protein